MRDYNVYLENVDIYRVNCSTKVHQIPQRSYNLRTCARTVQRSRPG
jgi:hypothetical protein